MAPKNSHGVTNLRATGFCLRRLARVIVSAGSLPLQPCRHSMQQRLCSLFWALELPFAKVSCCSLSGRIERQGKGRDMRGKRSPLPLRCLLLLGEKQGFQYNWNCYSLSAARPPAQLHAYQPKNLARKPLRKESSHTEWTPLYNPTGFCFFFVRL